MTINYKGMTISQNDYNHHVMITKNDEMIFHANVSAPCTEKELEDFGEICLIMQNREKNSEYLRAKNI